MVSLDTQSNDNDLNLSTSQNNELGTGENAKNCNVISVATAITVIAETLLA